MSPGSYTKLAAVSLLTQELEMRSLEAQCHFAPGELAKKANETRDAQAQVLSRAEKRQRLPPHANCRLTVSRM